METMTLVVVLASSQLDESLSESVRLTRRTGPKFTHLSTCRVSTAGPFGRLT